MTVILGMIGVVFSQVWSDVSACYGIMGTEVVNKPAEYVFLRWGVMVVYVLSFKHFQNVWFSKSLNVNCFLIIFTGWRHCEIEAYSHGLGPRLRGILSWLWAHTFPKHMCEGEAGVQSRPISLPQTYDLLSCTCRCPPFPDSGPGSDLRGI